ncbi:MAG TPA: hypothetical protein DEB06_09290 [Phycisphaerales bacterium]|nr:hypothetical protein [Phycisphaerales bacterium]
MAKMFYSLEEAAQRLGKSAGDVRQMAARGEITEFRDGERLLFKVDQIDLLSGDDDHDAADMSSMIPLAETGGASAINLAESAAGASGVGLSSGAFDIGDAGPGASGSGLSARSGSGSGMNAEGPKERSGIPVFDADELESADPSAQTQLSEGGFEGGLNLDALGSGSGLMDLTRESDDTSLGAEGLMDELNPAGEPSGGVGADAEGGLFEGSPTTGDLGIGAGATVAVAMAEAYDGAGSGLAGGLGLAMVASCGLAAALVIMSVIGFVPGFFSSLGGDNAPLIWTGALGGLAIVLGVVGWVLGKKSA